MAGSRKNFVCASMCAALGTMLCGAQTPVAFEVATVKPSPPASGDLIDINLGTFRNGKLTFANASLSDCLKYAYGVVTNDQIAGPDWIKSRTVRFDIVAQAMPDTPREELSLMLQSLLAERLQVSLHHEQKSLPWVALVVAKNGPRMREAKPGATGNPSVRGRIQANGMTMLTLANLLSLFERQTVLDRTGLKGAYEFKLEWTPDDNADAASGPSIFTALQNQLGLRLESAKGPLDVLVIDHAEKTPIDN